MDIYQEVDSICKQPQFRKLNLGCGEDVRPAQDNWINTDSFSADDVYKMNIFHLPWDFESDSFDYILARHVLEHVPHNIPEYGYETNFLQLLMEEIWRVMKPGAILDIEVPGGIASIAKAIDHKRIINPETFHVFYEKSKYSYYTKCRFQLVSVYRNQSLRFRLLRSLLIPLLNIDIIYLNSCNCRFFLRKEAVTQKVLVEET